MTFFYFFYFFFNRRFDLTPAFDRITFYYNLSTPDDGVTRKRSRSTLLVSRVQSRLSLCVRIPSTALHIFVKKNELLSSFRRFNCRVYRIIDVPSWRNRTFFLLSDGSVRVFNVTVSRQSAVGRRRSVEIRINQLLGYTYLPAPRRRTSERQSPTKRRGGLG